jgi:predicted MFS family arabinose efflux permease
MNFPDAVSTTALQSFTGDIFEGDDCAIAITDKNKYSALTNFIILILLGWLMKTFGKTNAENIYIYQLFFLAAFFISIFEIVSFYKLKQIKCITPVKTNIMGCIKEAKQNKKFMLFMLCSMTFHFGWQMGWPLFNIYQMQYLGADEMWLTIMGVTSGVVMFASFNYWKKLIINKGNSHAIALATTGMAITPILFAASPNLYVLTIIGLITGFFTAGTITVIVSSLLEVAPEKNRDMYFAIHATLTSVTLFISPFIGGFVFDHTSIYFALFVTAIFRFIGALAFIIRNKKTEKVAA